jgi:IS5 family transposase
MGHALIENRHGLVVAAAVSKAGGGAERNAALAMIEARADRAKRITLGADKGYDAQDFVNELRSMAVTPHVARKKRHSAIDKRTARHGGYATSQRRRKLVEEAFGWAKTIGGLARVKLRGLPRIRYQLTFAMAAYNLIRMPKLLAAT